MKESAKNDACSPVVELPDILDIKAATPLTVEFLTLRGRSIKVDASRVTRLGGLCLQVLLSATKTWAIDDNAFTLINPSSGFIDGLARFGISVGDLTARDKTQ